MPVSLPSILIRIICIGMIGGGLLGGGASNTVAAQTGDSLYWQQHQVDILGQKDTLLPQVLPLLDSSLRPYQFFFVGEVHWRKVNTRLQWAFLEHLYHRAGVRNLIVEGGIALGFLLNAYLESGETRLLEKALTDIPSCPEDEAVFFKTLYAFNQQLPDSSRIVVTGIDVDKSPSLSIQVLNTLLPETPPPVEIFPLMKRIETLHYSDYYDPKAVKRFFKKLDRAMAEKPKRYREFWGASFPFIRLLTTNTLDGYRFTLLRATLSQRTWQRREKRMYENFLGLQPMMAPGGYFGQFGALHTDIKESIRWEFPTLAYRLNHYTDSPVSNRVLTISRFAGKVVRYDRLQEGPHLQAWMESLSSAYPGKVVLCSLVGKETPFAELGKNFQFILWVDEALEKESCD